MSVDAPRESSAAEDPSREIRPKGTVDGKWFIPALFVGFVLFTLFMSFGTIYLAQAMKPTLQRRQIDAERRKAIEQRAAGQTADRTAPANR